MLLTYRGLYMLFQADTPAAQLPFQPPRFIGAVAQRGLTDPGPFDCSVVREVAVTKARLCTCSAVPYPSLLCCACPLCTPTNLSSFPFSILPPPPLQVFIFVLSQATLKGLVAKLLGWGPSKEMLAVQPWVPKDLRATSDKQA